MYAKTFGQTICGIYGIEIIVEVDVANGLPGFEIVGLPDTAVRESRERVKAAIKNSGFRFPPTKVVVNLAPADLKKDGSGLDLPIAIGILSATRQIEAQEATEAVYVGELALDGSLRGINGVLPMILGAQEKGRRYIYIPWDNAAEGQVVDDIKVYAPKTLAEVANHFINGEVITVCRKVSGQENIRKNYAVDFSEVEGQLIVKRALEIAAAGGHNVLMVGAPGAGKTMLARRLPTILPNMSEAEKLEVSKIYSVAGLLNKRQGLITERPFRTPHHTVSQNALVGGGRLPRPGEVTLSHNGVLFLDEFPEFSRSALEVLRQPMEAGFVTISRVQASLTFPAGFILVAAQNPCPCGYYGESDGVHECCCSMGDLERYRKKISGPLLDRIDLQVHVPRLNYRDLKLKTNGETSALIRQRVIAARNIQLERLKQEKLNCNSAMGHREIIKYCHLTTAAEHLLEKYYATLGLSARSHDRIIKVAQTIADLSKAACIDTVHLAEAIQLRTKE